jgi:subtilisin family serine protease
MTGLRRGLVLGVIAFALLATASPAQASSPVRELELVVALEAPALAKAVATSRALTATARRERLNLRSPTSAAYLRQLGAAQRAVQARIERSIPRARVRWRYRIVLNGLAVVVPAADARRLSGIPGVARVYPSVRYRALLDRSPGLIGAPQLWSAANGGTGNGLKIGIIDDGVDQSHPFFEPRGFSLPAGFPKGNRAYTTAKVIVARAFPPARPAWRHASKPFDPQFSEHATHVAGIAAGNRGVTPVGARAAVSGVAPGAYLGNYKVLTIPTASGVGLDGNSPEIAAGIEAAVRDGMDVINLSLGEPEIEPSRDLVVQAINAAAQAGVVPAIAAGNDFSEFGFGSVGSPGSAARAITAGAVYSGRSRPAGAITSFSSAGPTPISLQLKPDISAPGGEVLSSVPEREGSWAIFSGTSMAAPHIAGAAALLRQRHPSWTVAQVKSALVQTANPLRETSPTTRQGGGLVDLVRANDPLVFAEPVSVAFGLLRGGATVNRAVAIGDAGGGAGSWTAQVAPQTSDPRVVITAPATVTVPGRLDLTARAAEGAEEESLTGFVVLRRGETVRRIPYWLDVDSPALGRHRTTPLRRTGTYRNTTEGRPALVSSYRYPSAQSRLAGPEKVFRVRIRRRVANFGVAILSRAPGVQVEARVVVAGDENRQTGYAALPLNLNPYLADFLKPRAVSGALRPAPGDYDIVFDSSRPASAGRFAFRFWIDDTTPPGVKLVASVVPRGRRLAVRVRDAESGVDRRSILALVDGRVAAWTLRGKRVLIETGELQPGRHRLAVQVSDLQETRNNENVLRILPNTRRLEAAFTVR